MPHETDFYIGCTGINSFKAQRTQGSYDYTVPRIIGGSCASDVSKLILGDYNTSNIPQISGKSRLVDLQQTVDEELPRLHQLVGKKSSTIPYSDGFFNDPMLSTLTSLASAAKNILAFTSVSVKEFSYSSEEGDAFPHGQGVSKRLAIVFADADGKYEVFGSFAVGSTTTLGSSSGLIYFFKVNDTDIGAKYGYAAIASSNVLDGVYPYAGRLVYDLSKNDSLQLFANYSTYSGYGQFVTILTNLFLRRIGDKG